MMADEARVVDVLLGTAHDSESLLVLVLEFPNRARSQLQLDSAGTRRIVEDLALVTVRDLIGRRFSEIAHALPANARPR